MSASDSRRLGELQQRQRHEEFRTALRALLMQPLMSPVHADFATVRRQAEPLREWFARQTGWVSKSIRIELALIDSMLTRAGIAGSLRDALEQLDGPIVHRASADAERQARWAAVIAECRHPLLSDYLRTLEGIGLLKRLARQDAATAAELTTHTSAVLRRLPAGGLPRSQLAAEVFGNAHALDDGRAVATLLLATLRQRSGTAPDEEEKSDSREESRRSIWARAGVAVNELARPALVLNMPVQPGTTIGISGEPTYLSLRQLLRAPPTWEVAGLTIFVCENPNIVAIAADILGPHCAPLACTDGMPAAAQRTLLTQLAEAGARLAYHGDFDWPGLHIANQVIRLCGANPWRLGAEDYESAVAAAPHTERSLTDSSVLACWDDALTNLMCEHGLAISEEAVAASLIEDLRS